MKTIVFVCHGNICRSPAAEWIMKDLLRKYQLEDKFFVYSRATSLEEIGNDIFLPMKRTLEKYNIPFERHLAKRITKEDYDKADYIFYMDNNNLRLLNYLLKDTDNKFTNITEYTNLSFIEDPWYTDAFDKVVEQLIECCESIILKLLRGK